MKATIVTIGDEILMGSTVDTNSAWIGQQLHMLGIHVEEIISISDNESHILKALKTAADQSEVIIITGGLGPTKDDITKASIAKYFGVEMVLNEAIYERIKSYFEKRGRKMVEMNKKLAMLPANCTTLTNNKGTAAGMWFYEDGKAYISLPGVPHEMKEILSSSGFAKIAETFHLPVIAHKHIMTAGVGESILAEKLEDFENALPKYVKLAYLPGLGYVKLRLSAYGTDKTMLQQELEELTNEAVRRLGHYVYGYDEEPLEKAVGKLLMEKNATVGTAESCTGGNIARKLTLIPGSSRYFEGAVVAYSYEVKTQILGVDKPTMEKVGAVSEEVVIQMVEGLRKTLGVDYGVAVSGIAGPGGGTPEKPVGFVWMAVGNAEETITRKYQLTPSRAENIEITTTLALNNLRRFLTGQLPNHKKG